VRRSALENLAGVIGDLPVAAREGLPRNYRMRADSHYVDQLEARSDGRVIRLISIDEIDAGESTPANLDTLSTSIAAHGVLQPLLVRRSGTRYRLIAGQKRIAAAAAAGLSEVPCLVHDADDARAAALAVADNVRDAVDLGEAGGALARIDHLQSVLASIATELDALESSAALLRAMPRTSFQRGVAVDLMQAQSWRARWLARAASRRSSDTAGAARPLNGVLDRVREAFEAEGRLTGLHLEISIAPNAALFLLDDDRGLLAIAGGIFTTLSWMQGLDQPRLELHADAPHPRTLRIEIVQRMAALPSGAVHSLNDSDAADPVAAAGWLAMNALAASYGGSVEAAPVRGRGSVILLTITTS
jgi:ParB/RepB/Spo0J family partition protein